MLVKDVMSRKVLTVAPDIPVRAAARMLADNHVGCLVVVKNGKAIGMLTETDVLRTLAERGGAAVESESVEDAMSHYVIPTGSRSTIDSAVRLMTENKIKKLPVIDGGRLVGIITASDIISAQPDMIREIKRLITRKYEA